jgi:hypothetical protein
MMSTGLRVVVQSWNDTKEIKEIRSWGDFRMTVLENCADVRAGDHSVGAGDEVILRRDVGRDYGAFCEYILTHYDSLEGDYLFMSANLKKHRRRAISKQLIKGSSTWNPIAKRTRRRNNGGNDYRFEQTFYVTRRGDKKQVLAPLRPFGAWFEAFCGPIETFWQWGPFQKGFVPTTASCLKRYPKRWWDELSTQINAGNATELVHYVEKASAFLFSATAPNADQLQQLREDGFIVCGNGYVDVDTAWRYGNVAHNASGRKQISLDPPTQTVLDILRPHLDTIRAYLGKDRLVVLSVNAIRNTTPRPQSLHRDYPNPRCVVTLALPSSTAALTTEFIRGSHTKKTPFDDAMAVRANICPAQRILYDAATIHRESSNICDWRIFIQVTMENEETDYDDMRKDAGEDNANASYPLFI